MSWKPPKRTLQNVSKIKLTYDHPLPEDVDDVSPVNDFVSGGEIPTHFQKNGSYAFAGFNSHFPVASQAVEESYLDILDKSPGFDQDDDSDLDYLLYSEFGGTDESSLDDSSASYLSWADDIELEGAERTKELFEELEMALYDEEPDKIRDEELSNECIMWRSSHLYLRVVGKKPCTQEISEQCLELSNECEEYEEEVIESHGCIEESSRVENVAESRGSASTPNAIHSGNLVDKVKVSVLEQLTFYALSEALKSFEQDQIKEAKEVRINSRTPPMEDAVSTLANLSEDLGRALQISGRSIHRTPKMLCADIDKKALLTSSLEHNSNAAQHKRFLSHINVIPEDKIYITPENSFSVLGVPKPLNSELLNSRTKILEKRGFHSAADRKRPGILDRRFSCVSPEHDKLLKPACEIEDCAANSPVIVNSKQVSAPNTPLKLLRHLTLPPIQNLNSYNKLSVNSEEKVQPSLTHIRRIFVKNKVSLTPLPNAVNINEGGFSELQLAKKLLDSTPDSGRWSTCRKIGFSGFQNGKSRKKSIEKYFDNP